MPEDQSPAPGRRRARSMEAAARADALKRLQALRSGGRRTSACGYEIKMESPIYDTVPEDEYNELVSKRREEVHGFIVDDNGLGYGDEGQEEDWSQGALPPSDESDADDSDYRTKRRKKENKEKDVQQKKNSSSLSSAMIGNNKISSMFTSSVFKNRDSIKIRNLELDSIVDDVIAEFAPDQNDREKRKVMQKSVTRKEENKSEQHKDLSDSIGSVKNIVKKVVTANVRPMTSFEKCYQIEDRVDSEQSFDDNTGPEYEAWDGYKSYHPINLPPTNGLVKDDLDRENNQKPASVMEEKNCNLNAKIKVVEEDPSLSAVSGWRETIHCDAKHLPTLEDAHEHINEETIELDIDADGSLQFYILDAHEEILGPNAGTIYMFGKVRVGNMYKSCCVLVKNMQRCVYAVPNSSIFHNDEMARLENDVEESIISRAAFHKKLHDISHNLKNEVAKHLVALNVSSFSMIPVKRNFVFDQSDMFIGEQYVLKISYSFKGPALPADLNGDTFHRLLGTNSSALELLLVKRKIKGPSWLSISKFSPVPLPERVSWCKFEIAVNSPKQIQISCNSKIIAEIPPVVVAAINLKVIVGDKQNVGEVASASVVCCKKAKIDTPMLLSECNKPGMITHFTVVRKLDGILPMGFIKEVDERNAKAGSNILSVEISERALLNRLMIALHNMDADILVGHNISGYDLDIVLNRSQACKVPCSMWSKIGRLKRSVMPKLTKGNNIFGSGASPGIMSCIAGRLLCDTFLCSRDLLKEVSYSLTQLAKTRLNKERKELAPHDIAAMFHTSGSLLELVECGETDAWLSMELMFHLSVLPLTRQLTNISGNLWGKTLQGSRAQRVEFLLLHAFHSKKYIIPDKVSAQARNEKISNRKRNGYESSTVDDVSFGHDSEIPPDHLGKIRKGPAYAGGLVLEPKKGFYDKYVLLLDFNSLYPSIIQEYNICFTTVERSPDGLVPHLPTNRKTGVLPELLKNLVERRRLVKTWMKNASGLKLQQLDIQQQALKLSANSIYGCLGFPNSRFYAKSIAELITQQGRDILQNTVDLVNNLNLEVIYGDTDSIMIYSGMDEISKARAIAARVIQEVNKKYRCLEIDLDGLYKRMLLLKKKKYAAVKMQFKDGMPYEVIERKGLDMVRRDWSLLSKELGDFCLAQILSEGSCDDVVESIHNALRKVQEQMRTGQVALEKYVITKTLTKPPEAYPDAKNQPHVQVALRLKQSGYTSGCSVGDTIPYIICCEKDSSSGCSTGMAHRARHPDELTKGDGNWLIDIDYYLSQQIHPVVSRLCASIEGTSPERLADCLGLDPSKFEKKLSAVTRTDPDGSFLFSFGDERYSKCEPLILACPSCSATFDCSPISNSLGLSLNKNPAEESSFNFWKNLCCPTCAGKGGRLARFSPSIVSNQVKRQADKFIAFYYNGVMVCDDESCKHETRRINLQVIGDSERGSVCPNYPHCNGRLLRKYTEADLYTQLSYFCYILDTRRAIEQMDPSKKVAVVEELANIRAVVDPAAATVGRLRDRCAYGWVRLSDISVTV